MDKRGSVMLSVLFAVIFFIAFIILINFIKPLTSETESSLNCSDVNISDGNKMTCLIINSAVPYFIALIISVAGGIILDRLLT